MKGVNSSRVDRCDPLCREPCCARILFLLTAKASVVLVFPLSLKKLSNSKKKCSYFPLFFFSVFSVFIIPRGQYPQAN